MHFYFEEVWLTDPLLLRSAGLIAPQQRGHGPESRTCGLLRVHEGEAAGSGAAGAGRADRDFECSTLDADLRSIHVRVSKISKIGNCENKSKNCRKF